MTHIEPVSLRFPLGHVYVTANADRTLGLIDIGNAIARHAECDWGDVSAEDRESNDRALEDGSRLFSVYHTGGGTKFWIITEADRSVTTVLLPEDY